MHSKPLFRTALILLVLPVAPLSADNAFFNQKIAPILEQKCLRCHNEEQQRGKLSLETEQSFRKGGRTGPVLVPGQPDKSLLLKLITPVEGSAEMPKNAPSLAPEEITAIRLWLQQGAKWPKGARLKAIAVTDAKWWSLQRLTRPPLPSLPKEAQKWVDNPIDSFILARQKEQNLTPSPQAPRRALIRRAYYDLIGLPPSPKEVAAFVASSDPMAYEKMVDRLLASPRYGERWARHWLDVVHYADTHGYDKDKIRPNAWPYRDYVIRAFNQDRPYSRFIREQIAGDALYPGSRDGQIAPGFLASGPWDFIGHAEVPESKIDGKVARNLDRDDMVRVTMNTFNSLTVGCARCHDHKFDPISQERYYGLQAVFAALDRADRLYDPDPKVAAMRHRLQQQQQLLSQQQQKLKAQIQQTRGPEIIALDQQIKQLQSRLSSGSPNTGKPRSPAYGYHSQVARRSATTKWVQVDLGKVVPLQAILLAGADEYGFADFGFPDRFRVEAATDPQCNSSVVLLDHTAQDHPRPGPSIVNIPGKGAKARYVRVTATKLWERRMRGQKGRGDWIFAIGEMAIVSEGRFVKPGAVQSLDSIEALPRWGKRNLIDGIVGRYPLAQRTGTTKEQEQIARLTAPSDLDRIRSQIKRLSIKREALFAKAINPKLLQQSKSLEAQIAKARAELSRLPAPQRAYVATVHKGQGNFRGRAGLGPREIRLLTRGDVTRPGKAVAPGALPIVEGLSEHFNLPKDHSESERRIALAQWLTHKDNALTWRSIVNRVWLYHFGKGIVETPNDFGRMGAKPSHPQLLEWLAVEFRDGGKWLQAQSLKSLHRLILTSRTYRQASASNPDRAQRDGGNRYLWRMNRRRLDAEAIRDSVLLLSDRLSTQMGGPGFRDFVLEKPEHSPHYEYHKHNPDDPDTHRRAVYRFLVRSQQEPFMETLDCADPSQMVPKRHSSLTALQALTLLNNKFMLRMAEHFASRLQREEKSLSGQVQRAYRLALGRSPTPSEQQALTGYAKAHGLANLCRLILNLNEFVFVD